MKRESLPFRSSYIKDEHYEFHPSSDTLLYDWWVLVAYPRKPIKTDSTAVAVKGLSREEQRLVGHWRSLGRESREALLTLLEHLSKGSGDHSDTSRKLTGNVPVLLFVHHGLGTTKRAMVWGRVVAGDLSTSAKQDRIHQPIVNASVSLKIFGKEHPVETDAEGNFVLELKGPLPVGTHVIEASAKNPRTRYVQRGWVTIFPPDGGTVVISSVRHTMVRASRLCKAILALSPQSVLLARPRHLKTCTRVYPGVLETVSRWNKEKQPVVFISDLPADSYVLFRRVLKVHGFPKIPLVFAGRSIKDLTKRARILLKAELISQILDLLPNHQVILVGNDVDTDVDAFALAQKKHGSRIDNVYIHRVPFRSDHQKLKPGQKRIASFREIRKIHR